MSLVDESGSKRESCRTLVRRNWLTPTSLTQSICTVYDAKEHTQTSATPHSVFKINPARAEDMYVIESGEDVLRPESLSCAHGRDDFLG